MSLIIENLDYSYRDFSLNAINLLVNQGEILCLVGESGSGKSTLLRLIAGLEKPRSGRIAINQTVFDRSNSIDVPPEKRNIAMIFQHLSLFPNKTIFENVKFAVNSGLDEAKVASEMLRLVGMSMYRNIMPFQISGGQQQLVTLARAFAQFPLLLLLDEPFSSLDAILRASIREKMISLIRDRQLTTVIVTHDPYEALEIADRLVIIRNGKIIMNDSPEIVYSTPKDRRVAELFGILNSIDVKVSDGKLICDFGEYELLGVLQLNEKKQHLYCRPEGIKLSHSSGIEAVVEEVRQFSKLVKINLNGKKYWARHLLGVLPQKYDKISVELDVSALISFD